MNSPPSLDLPPSPMLLHSHENDHINAINNAAAFKYKRPDSVTSTLVTEKRPNSDTKPCYTAQVGHFTGSRLLAEYSLQLFNKRISP